MGPTGFNVLIEHHFKNNTKIRMETKWPTKIQNGRPKNKNSGNHQKSSRIIQNVKKKKKWSPNFSNCHISKTNSQLLQEVRVEGQLSPGCHAQKYKYQGTYLTEGTYAT